MMDLAPEDAARANFYALLARLWHSGPDPALLGAIADADEIVAEGPEARLAEAWRQLKAAAAATDAETARAEHEALFVGTGKAPVTPYASHYLVETARERVLIALRDDLVELGLKRDQASHEPEDHFAALCEVMRHLVAAGSSDAALQRQKKFFTRYIQRAYNLVTDEVMASTKTSFYGNVARFTKAFCDTEAASLDML
ncbi:MAG TPA: molecular chaperone TorD family protein [Burkholderiales bacterium]|nr:molecular chaperone TorD family protein [Burkholderiales bacterium]